MKTLDNPWKEKIIALLGLALFVVSASVQSLPGVIRVIGVIIGLKIFIIATFCAFVPSFNSFVKESWLECIPSFLRVRDSIKHHWHRYCIVLVVISAAILIVTKEFGMLLALGICATVAELLIFMWKGKIQ